MYTGIPNITDLRLSPNSSAAVCVGKTQEKAVVLAPYLAPNSHTIAGKTGIASLSDYSSLSSSLASLHSNSPVGTLNTANKNSFRNCRPIGDQSSDYRYSLWLKMRVCPYYLLLPPSSGDFRATASNKSFLPSSTSPSQLTTNSISDANADANIQVNKNCPLTKESCPFAHPAANVRIEAGHVTVCYDYIKRNKCKYTCCKYFHPPYYQIEEILKRGNEQRRLNHTQPKQSPLSNGGGGLASTSTSTCNQPPSTASATTVAKTAGIHWQPTSGAYNAYRLSGAAAVGLHPPAATAALHSGQVTAMPLPFSSASAAASTDPSLFLAAVLQQQQQQQRAAAAMLMAPVNSAATTGGGGSSAEAGNADGSSGGGSLPSHPMTTTQPTSAVSAATNGVYSGVSVSEFAQQMMALHHHQQQPVYDSSQSLRQPSHRSSSSPSLTACSPAVVTAAFTGTSSTAATETSTAWAADIPNLLVGVSSTPTTSTAAGLCPGTKRKASDALVEAAEPIVDLHAWLSAKRAAHHPGTDLVTDYGQMEGHNSSAMCNGASAGLLAGSYIAGVAEQQQQQHRAEAELLSVIGDNPSSMAVASLPPAFSSPFAYQPTGYCPNSSIQHQLAAAAAAASGPGGGLFNFYGLPYIQTAATAQYPTTVYSTPQQAIGAGVDSQASITALALNNMLSQQSPAGQPVAMFGMPGQQTVFPGTPHQMANFAATLATWQQQQQQQQSSTDLRQMAAAPAAAAAPQQTAAFHQNQQQQQQQQQQAFFSALLRAHQSQLQQQLVAAQIAAAMQQVTGGAAYASQPSGSCIMDAQFPNGINGIATMASPYTVAGCYPGVVQLQSPITNVAYINEKGNLLETLPVCRDFGFGKCHRNMECRYVHLLDENVEVNNGRVTVCRDAAKGRCSRVPCKYFHVPLFAISAHRSLALNSVLHNSDNAAGGGGGGLVMAASATTGNSVVRNSADGAAAIANGAGSNNL